MSRLVNCKRSPRLPLAVLLALASTTTLANAEPTNWLEQLVGSMQAHLKSEYAQQQKQESVQIHKQLIETVKKDPNDIKAVVQLARDAETKEHDEAKALTFYERAYAIDPGNKATLELVGILVKNPAHRRRCVDLLRAYLKANKSDSDETHEYARREFALLAPWFPDTLQESLPELRRLVKENPSDDAATITLARMLNWHGLGERESENLYRSYLRRHPDDYKAREEMANLISFQSPRYAEGAEEYSEVIKHEPNNEQLRLTRAILYTWMGKPEKAVPDLKRLADKQPFGYLSDGAVAGNKRKIPVILFLAQAYRGAGQLSQSEQLYQKYLSAHAADSDVRLEYIDVLLREGKTAEAMENYEKAIAADSNSGSLRLAKAFALDKLGRKDECVQEIQKVVDANPFFPMIDGDVLGKKRKVPPILLLARFQAYRGQVNESKQSYERFLAANPNDHAVEQEMQENLARAAMFSDDLLKSSDYEQLMAKTPDDLSLKFRYALALRREHKDEAAIAELRKLVAIDPFSTDAFLMCVTDCRKRPPIAALAQLLFWKGDYTEASKLYQQYLAKSPDDWAARIELAELGQFDKQGAALSLDQLQQVEASKQYPVELEPKLALIRANALRSLGQFKAADEAAERAIQLGNESQRYSAKLLEAKNMADAGKFADAENMLRNLQSDSAAEKFDAQEILARILSYQPSRRKEALNLMNDLLADHADNVQLRYDRANCLLWNGDAATAAKELGELSADHPSEKYLRRQYAKALQEQGSTKQAQAIYSELLSQDPSDAQSAVAAARLHFEDGDAALAEKVLRTSIEQKADNAELKLCLARVVAEKNISESEALVAQALESKTATSEELVNGARLLAFGPGTNPLAIKVCQHVLQADPNNLEAKFTAGQLELLSPKTKKEGLAFVKDYLQSRPDEIEAQKCILDAMTWSGERASAEAKLEAMIKAHPDDRSLLFMLSRAEAYDPSPGKRAAAISHLNQYLQYRPNDIQARALLAELYSYGGRRKEAIKIYEELMAKKFDPEVVAKHAQVLSYTGKSGKAYHEYLTILEKDPKNKSALLGLGQMLNDQGEHFKAESFLKRARDIYPDDAVVNLYSALNFRAMGRYDKAARYTKLSVEEGRQ